MIVGLDYDYVRSHGAYRQALRQAILRARELGSKRVLLGMGATFEKTRFGAHVQERVAFAQASDHYCAEVLAALAAEPTIDGGSAGPLTVVVDGLDVVAVGVEARRPRSSRGDRRRALRARRCLV